MSFWNAVGEGLAGWITPVTKGIEVFDQFVEDKDETNRLKAQIYITELQTKTIPIFDAIHKVGRQAMNWAQFIFYAYCVTHGIELDWETVAGISGCAGIYTAVKGKGK